MGCVERRAPWQRTNGERRDTVLSQFTRERYSEIEIFNDE